MKKEIHPQIYQITAKCNCGNEYVTGSTVNQALSLDICSNCHPFYTGQQKLVDSSGRVERFYKRFDKSKSNQADTKS